MPVIETARLILRGWRDEDIKPWVAMNADTRVMEFFKSVYSRERAETILSKLRAEFERDGYGWWVAEEKSTGAFLGSIVLMEVPFETRFTPATEIGWRLAFDAWGKGYATEGALAAIRFAFEKLGRDELVAMTARINLRSRRVMGRLGMTYNEHDDFKHADFEDGHPLRPHVLYRLQRESWVSRSKSDVTSEIPNERRL